MIHQPIANPAFSEDLPGFQTAWDSVSYKAFSKCEYFYYLSLVCGYQPKRRSIHLTFGLEFHAAQENFHRLRASGTPYEEAIHEVISAVYYRQLKTPEEKALSYGYHDHSLPATEPTKTPTTLIRSLVWYFDQFKTDTAKTFILGDGSPAIELSFSFPILDGTLYCGHLDRVVEYNGSYWIHDYKTTKGNLGSHYFSGFSPDIQMTAYTIAGQIVFDVPAKGVIVDATRLGVTFAEFARMPIQRTASQLDEFIEDFSVHLDQARTCAEREAWPMRRESCGNYGGCQFRQICAQAPSVRENFLRADFTQRVWNPLQER